MTFKYILTIDAMGAFPKLEIDQLWFEDLKVSKTVISHALALEENYEMVIVNYLDFEREITNACILEMVRNQSEYKGFFEIRLALMVRLINLLTAVRSCSGQLPNHVSKCIPLEGEIKNEIKDFFSKEYDKSPDFRFMMELRNHAQHSGSPIHRISKGVKLKGLQDTLFEYSVNFYVEKKDLLSDNSFKKKVLDEMPEKVDIKSATRNYIEAISRIHSRARERIEKNIYSARSCLGKAIEDYANKFEEEPTGLCA